MGFPLNRTNNNPQAKHNRFLQPWINFLSIHRSIKPTNHLSRSSVSRDGSWVCFACLPQSDLLLFVQITSSGCLPVCVYSREVSLHAGLCSDSFSWGRWSGQVRSRLTQAHIRPIMIWSTCAQMFSRFIQACLRLHLGWANLLSDGGAMNKSGRRWRRWWNCDRGVM